LALRVEVNPALPPARFEHDALLQVIFNPVDNAVKYATGATHREIVLRGTRVGDRIVLAARDHRPGVPAGHLGKIFEPFYRGERELTRRSKGTGLGLALVRGLAEGMGATVVGRNARDGGFEVETGWSLRPAELRHARPRASDAGPRALGADSPYRRRARMAACLGRVPPRDGPYRRSRLPSDPS